MAPGRTQFDLHTLDDLAARMPLSEQTVLVRVDFNVPVSEDVVTDDTRIELSLPTIRRLCDAGAKVVLMSHRGRPKGQRNEQFSLRPVARRLAELLPSRDVTFARDCVGEAALEAVRQTAFGNICMLENVRFHAAETSSDETLATDFATQLCALGDIFVGDAFGTAHRAHASVVGVASQLEHRAAGHLMMTEVEALGRLLDDPPSPFVGILGGAKIAGKIETLENLLPRLDVLLVGGGMANTFLAAAGHDLAASLVENERLEFARDLIESSSTGSSRGPRVVLPTDLVVTDDLGNPTKIETVGIDAVPPASMAVDIGPKTVDEFSKMIGPAAALFWNGPLGVFEKPPFDQGTEAIARCLPNCRGFTVIGGGETVAAINRTGASEHISHVSTGGGASLALLAGKTLPGIAILEKTS